MCGWVGGSSVFRVHSAQSAFAPVPSQLGCSQMVAHQPTVSEVQPIRGGKQKTGPPNGQGTGKKTAGRAVPNDVNSLCICP